MISKREVLEKGDRAGELRKPLECMISPLSLTKSVHVSKIPYAVQQTPVIVNLYVVWFYMLYLQIMQD